MKTRAFLLAVVLGLSACSRAASTDLTLPGVPDRMVLRVETLGGFAPIEWLIGRGPAYVVTGDGSLYFEGPTATIFPGPLFPNLQVGQLSSAEITDILTYVDDLALPALTKPLVNDEMNQFVADAGTTAITYYDTNGAHRYSVYALGIDDRFSDARPAILRGLVSLLDDAASRIDARPHEPDRIQVFAGVSTVEAGPEFSDVRAWPLPMAPDTMHDVGIAEWPCEVITDSGTTQALSSATQATTWDYEGTAYTLIARPLIPGEPGCSISM